MFGRKPEAASATENRGQVASVKGGVETLEAQEGIYAGARKKYARTKAVHPLGTDTHLQPPPSTADSPEEFFKRTLANAVSLTWMSVEPSTLTTYMTGWRQWVQ